MSKITQPYPSHIGTEKEMLYTFLDYHRAAILHKVEGLSDEDMRRQPLPSSAITLLSLLKHLAYNERSWIHFVFGGEKTGSAWPEDDEQADWRIEPGETTEQILAFYQATIEKSRQITANRDLDDLSNINLPFITNQRSLRWILLGVIEETIRHSGHADLLREAIDGVTYD